jgi:hypothetical protein
MKYILLLISLSIFSACNVANDNSSRLQAQIDSLKSKLSDTYKPGFGEFMSSIQVHHNKLWFAGENNNWNLADFEIHEIQEAIEDIEKFQTEREESQKIEMIKPALGSVISAITQKNSVLFKSSFVLLTNTCNNCHRATNFEFNQVKIPDNPPFSNQIFKLPNEK